MQLLDIDFHKTSSKNTVFAVNRAIRSIESGMRFTMGFALPIVMEFGILCTVIWGLMGPMYLGNTLLTLGLYTYFTKSFSEIRRVQMQKKKNVEKQAEFYLNESTMNYESVKSFNNEDYDAKKYNGMLDGL